MNLKQIFIRIRVLFDLLDWLQVAAASQTAVCWVTDRVLGVVVQIGVVHLLIENACIGEPRVEFDPRGGKHEVDVVGEFVAPELDYTFQVKLGDHIVSFYQSVHVGSQAVFGVDAFLVELDFDEAVWVCADDEVDFGPVNHDDFLDVVYDMR